MATGADNNPNNDLDLSEYLFDDVWIDGLESGVGAAACDNGSTAPSSWQLPEFGSPSDLRSLPLTHTYSTPLSLDTTHSPGGQFGVGLHGHSAPPDERSFDTLMLQHWRDASWRTSPHDGSASWTKHSHVPTSQDFPILEADLFHQADGFDPATQITAPPMANSFSSSGEYITGYDPTKKAPSVESGFSVGSLDFSTDDMMKASESTPNFRCSGTLLPGAQVLWSLSPPQLASVPADGVVLYLRCRKPMRLE